MKSSASGARLRTSSGAGARRLQPHQSAVPTITFFGGKGGVGKTTCAAATAVVRAANGRRVIVISTDPAHSLGDALRARVGARPTRVRLAGDRTLARRKTGRLDAVELDADRVLERWLDEHRSVLVSIGERGTYLDRDDIERLMDLSFPGVSELLALRRIVQLVSSGDYDDAIVDTAPTGHTLRLLSTPEALERLASVLDILQQKHRALVEAVNRAYRADAADRLIAGMAEEAAQLRDMLRDSSRARFVWVTLAEPLAIEETRDALRSLEEDGIIVDTIIVNRVTPRGSRCPSCRARRRDEVGAVQSIGAVLLRGKKIRRVPLLNSEPVGIPALRAFGAVLEGSAPTMAAQVTIEGLQRSARTKAKPHPGNRSAASRLRRFLNSPPRLIFSMGKGGVGKTTCAAAIAIAIAERRSNRRVLLLSIDPAHSVGDVLAQAVGNRTTAVSAAPGLFARELDAEVEFQRAREAYQAAIDDLFAHISGDSRLDITYDRQVARELIELAPPGLDELFALITIVNLAAEMGTGTVSPGAAPEMGTGTVFEPPSSAATGTGTVLQKSTNGACPQFRCVVIDMPPTGHALRLFEMREQAHAWVRTLMSVLLKYRGVVRPGALAADLVAFSRGLRQLAALLDDATQTAFIAVTRAAALPRLETDRLVVSLRTLGLAQPAFVIVNAATMGGHPATCEGCLARAAIERTELARLGRALRDCAIILAPALAPPPRGVPSLRRWIEAWQPA